MVRKRTFTAYFLFAEEYRARVRQELLDAAGDGHKVGVAEVGKALGDKWRALSDAEKDKYKALAQQKTEEHQAQAAEDGEDTGGDAVQQQDDAQQQQQNSTSLPLGAVKKIMLIDKDVSRASADGVRAIAIATELFLGLLGAKCSKVAKSSKRRTILLKDFEQAVRYDRRLVTAGLKEVAHDAQQRAEAAAAAKQQRQQDGDDSAPTAEGSAAEVAGDASAADEGKENQQGSKIVAAAQAAGAKRAAKKAKAGEPPSNNHSIMTFFVRPKP